MGSSSPTHWDIVMSLKAKIEEEAKHDILAQALAEKLHLDSVGPEIPPPTPLNKIPITNLFDGIDDVRVETYFSELYLGFGFVSAFAGSGKSHLAAVIVTLMCNKKDINHVIACAPSSSAADKIANRITSVTRKILAPLVGTGSHISYPAVIGGYAPNTELEKRLAYIEGSPPNEDDDTWASPWRMNLSLCQWTLRVLGFQSKETPPLTPGEPESLLRLHGDLMTLRDPDAVARLEAEHQSKLDKGLETRKQSFPFHKYANLVHIANESPGHSQYSRTGKQNSIQKDLERLMKEVVLRASVVVTTPILSDTMPYEQYNKTMAGGVVFYDAGAMFRADALLTMGNAPRLSVAFGDDRQLGPTLMTAMTKDSNGFPVNRFAEEAKISWLTEWFHIGWPIFHLYTQHRMMSGQFDFALETFYPHMKRYFSYASDLSQDITRLGKDIEDYTISKYGIRSAAPEKYLPIFVNCQDCPCETNTSGSRVNRREVDVMAKFIIDLISNVGMVETKDIAVLTPYNANLLEIKQRFSQDIHLKDIQISTVDSFRYKEAKIVFCSLAATRDTGPGFTADPLRLSILLTGHQCAMFLFGDININARSRVKVGLSKVLGLFSRAGRVIDLYGDESIGGGNDCDDRLFDMGGL